MATVSFGVKPNCARVERKNVIDNKLICINTIMTAIVTRLKGSIFK